MSLCFNLNVIREQAVESEYEIVQNRLIADVILTHEVDQNLAMKSSHM